MKEDIFSAISNISDEYILNTEKKAKRISLPKAACVSAAAAVVIICFAALPLVTVLCRNGEKVPDTTSESTVTVPEAVEFEIENGVLLKYNGTGGDVTIPEAVREIADGAFPEVEINVLTITDNVQKIGASAFTQCAGIAKIEVTEGNDYFYVEDGLCYLSVDGQVYVTERSKIPYGKEYFLSDGGFTVEGQTVKFSNPQFFPLSEYSGEYHESPYIESDDMCFSIDIEITNNRGKDLEYILASISLITIDQGVYPGLYSIDVAGLDGTAFEGNSRNYVTIKDGETFRGSFLYIIPKEEYDKKELAMKFTYPTDLGYFETSMDEVYIRLSDPIA